MRLEEIVDMIGRLRGQHLIVRRETKDSSLTSFGAYKSYSITIYKIVNKTPIQEAYFETTDKFIESTKDKVINLTELAVLRELLLSYGIKAE